jgi:hypothetical protein
MATRIFLGLAGAAGAVAFAASLLVFSLTVLLAPLAKLRTDVPDRSK